MCRRERIILEGCWHGKCFLDSSPYFFLSLTWCNTRAFSQVARGFNSCSCWFPFNSQIPSAKSCFLYLFLLCSLSSYHGLAMKPFMPPADVQTISASISTFLPSCRLFLRKWSLFLFVSVLESSNKYDSDWGKTALLWFLFTFLPSWPQWYVPPGMQNQIRRMLLYAIGAKTRHYWVRDKNKWLFFNNYVTWMSMGVLHHISTKRFPELLEPKDPKTGSLEE